MKMLMSLSLIALPAISFAQETTEAIDVNATFQAILEAIKSGNMVIAAAGVVLILVFLFRKYAMPQLGLPSGILPLVSIVVGSVMGFLSNIVLGLSPLEAAKIALLSGPSASVLWASLIKWFLPSKPVPPKAP